MKNIDNRCLLTQKGQTKTLTLTSDRYVIHVPRKEHIDLSALVFSGDVCVQIILEGEQSSCDLKCVYLVNEQRRGHIQFDVVHASGDTFSQQKVKGIVTDMGRAVFEGTIHIPRHCQKCDASQNHRAILMSDQADVTAVPELEIYADDVKCAHGSAIGPLPSEHLFYLMSRGIPKTEAEKLLLHSFVSDVLDPSFVDIVKEWMMENV